MTYEWFPDIPDNDVDHNSDVEIHEHPARVVRREEWGAREAREKERFLEYPLPYIVAMHTKTRPCYDKEDCCRAVKEIQDLHMSKGEPDIIYNYLIDMEGNIYIGRGPSTVSMTYPETDKKLSKANEQSLTIGFIGSGGGEPPELAGQGAASLLVQLYEGRYIDETIKYLWYDRPPEGVPDLVVEDHEETEEDPVNDMIDRVCNALVMESAIEADRQELRP